MESIEIRADSAYSVSDPKYQQFQARFQARLDELAAKIQANGLAQLAAFDRKSKCLEVKVSFKQAADARFDLVPNLDTVPSRKALSLEMELDGEGLQWLEDAEILHRVELAVVTGIAMLVRSSKCEDAGWLQWLRGLEGFVAAPTEGVSRCPYCHTRVFNERTRQCRRCGNAWHAVNEGAALPPPQAKRKLLQPAPRPDGLAALEKFPSGAFRYPYNLKKGAHPRARKLMPQAALWDIVNENAPFGSDEGHEALGDFQAWRAANPVAPLLGFLSWTMDSPEDWRMPLAANEVSDAVLAEWIAAAKTGQFDFHNEVWRRDTIIISSALAQLVFEGRIDPEAKPFVMLAVTRQSRPIVLEYNSNTRSRTLMMERIRAAIEAA